MCQDEEHYAECAKQWQKLTSSMFADPRTMGQPQISVTALGERFGFGTSESETEVMSSLAVHLALDAALITTKADQGDAAQWLQHDFNLPAVLKIAFFLQKQCEDSLREVSESAAKTRKKFEKLQANRIKVKEARQQNVEQAIVNLQPDDVTREQKLSMRNCRNRARCGVKKIRKARPYDAEFEKRKAKVFKAHRLTIFSKLQVVKYAQNLMKTLESKDVESAKGKKRRNPNARFRRMHCVQGVHLQRACEQKFPNLGKIKVGSLLRQADAQCWASLSIDQQKKWFQLPDHLKVAMGLSDKVKGWKNMSTDQIQEKATEQGHVQRWDVPGPVLQDIGAESY